MPTKPPRVARIGTIDRIPILIHWTLPTAIVAWLMIHARDFWGALGVLVGFVAVVLVHELGHAAAIRMVRQRVVSITLYAWGGECRYTDEGLNAIERSFVAWGGVLAQAIVLIVTMRIVGDRTGFRLVLADTLVWSLLVMNVITLAFNLLPIRGLDGHTAWQLPYHVIRAMWPAPRPTKITKKKIAPKPRRFRVIRGGRDDRD